MQLRSIILTFIALSSMSTIACERSLAVVDIDAPGIKPIAIELPTDAKSETGWFPAIALDSKQNLHIAYCDVARGDLRYGFRGADGVLHLETVASYGAVGKYVQLAIDANDEPHLMYFDQDNKFVKYTTKHNGQWLQIPLDANKPPSRPEQAERHEQLVWGPESGIGGRLLAHDGHIYAMYYVNRKLGGVLHLMTRKTLTQAPYGSKDAWHDEVIDKAGGSYSIWTDLDIIDGKLFALYPNWNYISSELRLASRPLNEKAQKEPKWKIRTIYPLSKKVPGWNSALVHGPEGFTLAFTTLERERLQIGSLPQTDDVDVSDLPVLKNFVNKMRLARAANGDLVVAAAETGRGRLGNSQLAILRRSKNKWQRYVVDSRRPVASQMDLVVNDKGQALILYWTHVDRGLWLYDETGIKTVVEGARPSPQALAASSPAQAASPAVNHRASHQANHQAGHQADRPAAKTKNTKKTSKPTAPQN